jgi:hypothetical protein
MTLESTADDDLTPASPTRYRALSPGAVVSLVLGVLSIFTVFGWSLAIIPIAGIVIGWRAQRRIRATPEEWTGLTLARWGIAISAALWVVGYGWLLLAGTRETPFGYTRVDYDTLQPDPNKPTEAVPESATLMNDKKVFIKGYMKPSRRQTGIKDFIMCPTAGECPFCIPNPKPTEMIHVVLQGGATTAFTNRQISIAGRLHVDLNDPGGLPYSLDADYVR